MEFFFALWVVAGIVALIWVVFIHKPNPSRTAAPVQRASAKPAPYGKSLTEQLGEYNDIIANKGFITLDVETTGLTDDDRIITLAAIHIHGAEVKSRLHLCFNPQRPSHPAARAVHGWRDRDLAIQPTLDEHVTEILTFLSRSPVWAGHNISFDIRLLKQSSPRLVSLAHRAHQVCTMQLAREILPNLNSHKLDKCLSRYKLARRTPFHNAFEDVALTAQLAFCLLDLPAPSIDLDMVVPTNLVRPLPSGRINPTEPTPAEQIDIAFDGLGPVIAQRLAEAGFRTPDEVRKAPDATLMAIKGMGPAKLEKIKGYTVHAL